MSVVKKEQTQLGDCGVAVHINVNRAAKSAAGRVKGLSAAAPPSCPIQCHGISVYLGVNQFKIHMHVSSCATWSRLMIGKLSAVVLVAGLLTLHSTAASAYLDPVTGSFLIQGLIGLVAAILVGIKRVRQKVLELLGFRKSTDKDERK
jgi:hypothetical protein